MADTGIFATTAEVERKAGANVSTTSKAEAYVNDYMTQAKSLINTVCRFNFSDKLNPLNAASLNTLIISSASILDVKPDMSYCIA